MKLQIGDRVRVTGSVKSNNIEDAVGKIGTIRNTYNEVYGVEFDFNPQHGHDLNEKLPRSSKSGLFIYACDLEIFEPESETQQTLLPADSTARKAIPLASGVLDYFSAALIEVAKVSYAGNQQHNPGQPLHWARNKSTDQADTLLRHFVERGTLDTDGIRHSAKMAWRALALLQLELEADGAPKARNAKDEEKK